MKIIKLLDIPLNVLTREQACHAFMDLARSNNQSATATPNAEICLQAQKDDALKHFLQEDSILNFADSVSQLWAGAYTSNKWSRFRAVLELILLPIRKKYWKNTFPETVTGSDLYLSICEQATQNDLSIFCLGSSTKISNKNKYFVQNKFPRLCIQSFSGDGSNSGDDETINKINEFKPDILFVAYGCPKQELWIKRNLQKCPSVKVAMGIGGTFDYYAGNLKRAPKLLQKLGLEWLWRLILQPSRIKRILNAVFIFPWKILKKGH